MLFDTPAYLIFLILVVLLYWRMGWRRQNLFLLAASYFFYGWWDWRFLLLMAGSTAIDFIIARKLEELDDRAGRRALLTFSLVVISPFSVFSSTSTSSRNRSRLPSKCWA